MKTKTDSFSKFITFCVLALFLFTNMILFTSCDNGNSPNDNTNEEQNNNVPTDYCEICDGVQTENCGIEHKCNDENCVEYADKKIYKNGHTHDYCENNDCDGSTHKGQAHPEYESWFQEAKIGGENSNICPMYVTEYTVNENNKLTTESVNNILDQYKKYVNNLNLDTTLSDGQIDFEAIKALTGANEPKKLDILISNINNVCAPAITEITKNIGVSDNKAFDKDKFNIYYWAIANEVYKYTCGTSFDSCGKAYYEEQKGDLDSYSIIGCWAGIHDDNGITPDFNIYNNDGTLNEKVINELDEMVDAVVTRFNNQGKNITKKDVYDKLNLSWTTSAIKGLHDDLCEVNALGNDIIDHTASEACKGNEMVNTIGNVKSSEMTAMISPKLNKSIFSQDIGRELC